MRPLRSHTLVLATLLFAGCGSGDEEPSLRDALDALPRDTSSAALPEPVALDTVGVQVDTLGMAVDSAAGDSTSVPWQPPIPRPNDTRPWVPEVELDDGAAAPGEWTNGIVARRRRASPMTVQSGIRTARHPEFDRVVLELASDDVPGYHLEYVDRPVRQCGSGDAVRVEGDGWLRVRLEPAQAHDDNGRATLGRENRAFKPALANVLEVRMICDFEGQVEWVIGVRSPNRYRVLELASPARLVVDIES